MRRDILLEKRAEYGQQIVATLSQQFSFDAVERIGLVAFCGTAAVNRQPRFAGAAVFGMPQLFSHSSRLRMSSARSV